MLFIEWFFRTTYQAQIIGTGKHGLGAGATALRTTGEVFPKINLTSRLGPCYRASAYPFTDIISYDEQLDSQSKGVLY